MRGSAHSPLALWVLQHCALLHRKESEQQEGRLYSPDTWGLMIRNTEHSVPGSPFQMPRIAQLFQSPVWQPERDKLLRRHGPPLHVYKRGAACGVLVSRESDLKASLASPCTNRSVLLMTSLDHRPWWIPSLRSPLYAGNEMKFCSE